MEFKIEKLYAGKNKIYKMLGTFLIIAAIAGASYPFWGGVFYYEQNPLEELGTSELAAQEITPNLLPVEGSRRPIPSNTPAPTPANRLIIPSANIDMPLFLSANEKTLLKGGWMYSGNSTPDKGGNTVIFGHRWLYKPPVKNTFYNLDEVAIGDAFTINWKGKTYTYEVSETKIVNPDDVYVLNPANSAQVTLITCTPLFSTKQRLVVIGKLI